MLRLVAQRIGAAVAVLFVVSLATFFVLRVVPGDAASLILGLEATPEKVEALRAAMGLDEPLVEQYVAWLQGLVCGDWGQSRVYGIPVLEAIAGALPVTAALAVLAMLVSFAVSAVLGVASALHQGTWVDWFARTVMQLGAAVPGFWLAVCLMLLFAGRLGWFPVSGFVPFSESVPGALRCLVLPAAVLAVEESGVLIRTVRSSTLTALGRDCLLSAQVKGLSRMRTTVSYVLRSALVAPLTVAGMQVAKLLGGTVVVESVFALPGLGRLLLTAVEQRDVMLAQGIVVFVTTVVVVVSLVVDLLVMAADPEVRVQSAGDER